MAQGKNAHVLFGRIAERDEKALAELYDACAPALLGMLLQILPDREAAEQVLQEVFLRLWREARRARNTSPSISLAAWLTIATRRAAVGRLRARRKLPPLAASASDSLEKSIAWLPRTEEIAALDERRELLKKVLNQLPKPQRLALDLAVFGGHTAEEISEQVGEPLGRVKRELRAAMTFFRHRLRAVLGTWAANI